MSNALAKSKNIDITFFSLSSAELIKQKALSIAFSVPNPGLKPNRFLDRSSNFPKNMISLFFQIFF